MIYIPFHCFPRVACRTFLVDFFVRAVLEKGNVLKSPRILFSSFLATLRNHQKTRSFLTFLVNVPLLYLLKKPENRCFRGYRSGTLTENRLIRSDSFNIRSEMWRRSTHLQLMTIFSSFLYSLICHSKQRFLLYI